MHCMIYITHNIVWIWTTFWIHNSMSLLHVKNFVLHIHPVPILSDSLILSNYKFTRQKSHLPSRWALGWNPVSSWQQDVFLRLQSIIQYIRDTSSRSGVDLPRLVELLKFPVAMLGKPTGIHGMSVENAFFHMVHCCFVEFMS